MSWAEFALLFGTCSLTMLACRVLPAAVLGGRELSQGVADALSLIPVAAYAALVANDLLAPGMFQAGLWPGAMPLVAAAVVCVVSLRTRSLIWSALAGIAALSLLSLV